MNKYSLEKNISNIKRFCSYLTDWQNKRDYYIKEFLPQIINHNYTGLPIEAKTLLLDIWKETSLEEWENLIEIIDYMQEHNLETSFNILSNNPVYNKILKENFKIKLPILKEKYNFQGFVHTTSFNNFINIMQDKFLYSRYLLNYKNKNFNEIALSDVIEKTSELISICVRFYWRTKTPTNYMNEGIKPQKALYGNYKAHSEIPVIMIFNPEIFLVNKNTFFTNKNAACNNRKILKDINFLDFNHIFDNTPKENLSEFEWNNIKQVRCAEMLYPIQISTDYISKIIFRSDSDIKMAQHILGYDNRFIVDKTEFCNLWLYVDNYNYDKKNNILKIYYYKGEKYKNGHQLNDYKHIICIYNNALDLIDRIDCSYLCQNEPDSITVHLNKNNQAKFLAYYINDIECIRMEIND